MIYVKARQGITLTEINKWRLSLDVNFLFEDLMYTTINSDLMYTTINREFKWIATFLDSEQEMATHFKLVFG